jgi:hypothetical protein
MSNKPIKLSTPHYRVVFGDPDDPESWTELDVQAITRDITAAETMWGVQHWGKMLDSPVKAMAVSAYFALKRTGQIEGDWASFEAAYIDIGQIGVDDVDPTDPGPAPG